MTFKSILEAIITQGLPMVAIYWLLDRPFVQRWLNKSKNWFEYHLGLNTSVVKRALAMVFSVALGVGVFSIYAGLGYAPFPVDFEGWANLIVRLGSIIYAGTQVIHSRDLNRG